MSKRLLLACSSAGLLLTLGGCGGPEDSMEGGAESSTASAELGLGALGSHCVTQTVAVEVGKPAPANLVPAPITCFATFADAIAFATNGAVQLSPTVTPQDLEESDLVSGTAEPGEGPTNGTYVIGVEYEHKNFGGSTLTYTSPYTCYGWNHSASGLPSGWNDEISSARAYSGCMNSYHYEHSNFGGYVMNCRDYCSFVGDWMNDRTSSLYWTQ